MHNFLSNSQLGDQIDDVQTKFKVFESSSLFVDVFCRCKLYSATFRQGALSGFLRE